MSTIIILKKQLPHSPAVLNLSLNYKFSGDLTIPCSLPWLGAALPETNLKPDEVVKVLFHCLL